MTEWCALYMAVLKIFERHWVRPRILFLEFLTGFCYDRWSVLWMRIKFELRSLTLSWDNMGYFKTLGSPWICPRSLFSKIFNGLLFGWTLWIYRPHLKSIALPFPDKNAIEVLGRVANPQSCRRGGRRGLGIVPFEIALVSCYQSINQSINQSGFISDRKSPQWIDNNNKSNKKW